MKQQETNRLNKIVEGLEKVKGFLESEKVAKAAKSVDSLIDKLKKKLSGSKSSSTKRAPSAWNLFYKANRDRVVRENPGLATSEVMKLIAKIWKQQGDKTSSSSSKKESPKAKKAAKVASNKKSPAKASPKPKATPKPRKPRVPKTPKA